MPLHKVVINMLVVFLLFGLLLRDTLGSKFAYEMLKAAENGETDKVVELINEKGVFLSTKNNYGVSAMIFAANNGHLNLVRKLVDMGANIEDRANNWRTPLLCASLWGHYDVVEYLVENGANVTVFDKEGMTTLMSAVVNGHTRIAKYLLTKDVHVTAVNFYNGTALSIARVKGDKELVAMLEPYFSAEEADQSPFATMLEIILHNLTIVFRGTVEFISGLVARYRPSSPTVSAPAEHMAMDPKYEF